MVDSILGDVFIAVLLNVFGTLSGIAAIVTPEGRRVSFVVLTFLLLGPLGAGFAAIAPPPLPDVEQTWKLRC